jgi:glycerate 2-kinase
VPDEAEIREKLLAIFRAGVAAVQAENCLPRHLPKDRPAGRTVLFALGKTAGHMARVALDHLQVDDALVVTRHGHMPPDWIPPAFVQVIEAGHPSPDVFSLKAGEAAMVMARSLGQSDRLIALISGGGSALMEAPVDGISFVEMQAINRALLASGAPVVDMNRARAAMSQVKGGRLAELACPAEVFTYVISDVPGDIPAFVASGPTCSLPNGDDALAILLRYGVPVSPEVAQTIGRTSPISFKRQQAVICAKASDALQEMARVAKSTGYEPLILSDDIDGNAEEIARAHAQLAIDQCASGRRTALISGGETSVAVSSNAGCGGRNLTYALALALELNGAHGIGALAADSDGIDGTSHAAGAIVLPTTLTRANRIAMCAKQSLIDQNSSAFFERLADALVTGPTGTNVNDLRIILVDPLEF